MPRPVSDSVMRLLDANANRAGEGLRVVEDYCRFVLEDHHLAGHCKSLRHQLAQLVQQFSTRGSDLLRCRDAVGDVGRHIQAADEHQRKDAGGVASASLKRIQQALRVLEEYSKLLQSADRIPADRIPADRIPADRIPADRIPADRIPAQETAQTTASDVSSRNFEQLRYDLYTLEKSIRATDDNRQRLRECQLYVLVDCLCNAAVQQTDTHANHNAAMAARARLLIEAGVDMLQLRDKAATDRQLLSCGQLLRNLTQGTSTLLIINDRPDIAAAVGADGVHVGQDELPSSTVRRIVGPRSLIGVSTHSVQQAQQAVLDGADYLGCGPTFASITKDFTTFAGLELLRQVTAQIQLPAFAIGGIDGNNLPQVLETGIRRIAVSNAVWSAADPAQAAKNLKQQLVPLSP